MKAKMVIDRAFTKGKADHRLSASHVEHAGRGVNNGIYEPSHPLADEEGMRKDVIEMVRDLGTGAIRYPGGNFVSAYRWEDGVGPKEQRPVRPELAWQAIEDNQFGLNEFMSWMKKVGNSEPMLTVNLGTRGIQEALDYQEYVNFPGGTYFSDLRRRHGYEKPYGVKTWFLGNEMDGPWQIGCLPGREYGRKAAQTAFAMRSMQPDLELILVGSSGRTMSNFPTFMADALDEAYDLVDLVSLHRYYGGQEGWWEHGLEDFLGVSLELDAYLKETEATCDYIKAKKRSKKTMMISLDEWAIWPYIPHESLRLNEVKPWTYGGPLAEGFVSYEEFIVGCFYVLTVMRHADRVKILCYDLLVNTCGPVHTEIGGVAWRQPVYYTMNHISRFARGELLEAAIDTPKYGAHTFEDIPYVDAVPFYDEETGELNVFCATRSLEEKTEFTIQLNGFDAMEATEHIAISCEDRKAVNGPDGERIFPHTCQGTVRMENGTLTAVLEPLSWNVLRLKKKA